MDNVEDLVCKFTRIDVVSVRMVSDERNVKGTNMWDVRQTLEEMML